MYRTFFYLFPSFPQGSLFSAYVVDIVPDDEVYIQEIRYKHQTVGHLRMPSECHLGNGFGAVKVPVLFTLQKQRGSMYARYGAKLI